MKNTNNIEAILRSNMDKVQELMKSETEGFTAKDGVIEYTGFVGKKGSLAKSSTAYVQAYLEASPIKGVSIDTKLVMRADGKPYKKTVFKYTKTVDANEMCLLFNEIASIGRKLYKEANK